MPLVNYYPLNETSDSTAYDLAGQNNGNVNGATQGASGILGATAYDFDGTDDDVSSQNTGQIQSTPFSVSLWFNVSSISEQYVTLVEQYDGGGWWIRASDQDSDGAYEIEVGLRDNSSNSILRVYPADFTIDDGAWHHIVCVADGISASDITVYIDGRERSLTTGSDEGLSDINHSSKTWMGYSNHNSMGRYNGKLSEVRIYDHALTLAEAQYLYQVSQKGRITTSKR